MNQVQEKIDIQGMTCGHCVSAVKRALEGLDGVKVQDVTIGSATIEYDKDQVDRTTIETAIEDAGYEVREAA